MGLQNDFNYEVAKRFIQQTQDIEYMRELSLNILEQCISQHKLLELWMGLGSPDFQQLKSRRGE